VIWAWVLVVRRLTWGLDLTGQAGDAEQSRDREGAVGGLASAGGVASGGAIPGLQGAGGIGGLLAADDANGTPGVTGDDEQYVFFYDAQGNVGQLVKDAVQPLARYEYDAYGRTIGPDADGDGDWRDDAGPFATTNPYRFSTKPCDDVLTYAASADTGLYDYGYRYYSPRQGRWTNRDPIEEDDWPHLYAAVRNNPVVWFDPDGRRNRGSQRSTCNGEKACCKYSESVITSYRQIGPMEVWPMSETRYRQESVSCQSNSPTARQCCACSEGFRNKSSRKILSAQWGACCSCTVSVWARNVGIFGGNWGRHRKVSVECPDDDLEGESQGARHGIGRDKIVVSRVSRTSNEGFTRVPGMTAKVDCASAKSIMEEMRSEKRRFYFIGIHDCRHYANDWYYKFVRRCYATM